MISRFLERKLRRSACALSSRDGPQSGPGSYRSVSSLARQEAPGYSANPAFRACGTAAKVTANPPPVRGRTGQAAFLRSARAGGCTPGMPASCVPQGRKGPRETSGAHALLPFDEARASARRSVARRDSGGAPPRACFFLSIKRERELAAPRREETAEALRRESLSGSTRRESLNGSTR